jgi:hypothetical protein
LQVVNRAKDAKIKMVGMYFMGERYTPI